MKSMKSVFRSKRKILVCAGILLAAGCAASLLSPMAQSVFEVHTAAAERKLPIYCVDTPDPKVAISFDAAWAEGRLMELKKY